MSEHFDPRAYLDEISKLADEDVDLAHAALALALVQHEGVAAGAYLHHLKTVVQKLAAHHEEVLERGGEDDVHSRLSSLVAVMSDEFGYTGDQTSYDDLQNASLVRVIDRGKGLPITLAILYMHAGRAQGWQVDGLNMPGHFVCRIEHAGERLIFDPFHDGKILEAADLRAHIKQALGDNAELSAEYYEPARNREVLIRLQNNLKIRKIDAEDYEGALEVVKLMRKIDPDEYGLLLDAGVLYARTHQRKAAIETLSAYIEKAPRSQDRYEAELLLSELSTQLN